MFRFFQRPQKSPAPATTLGQQVRNAIEHALAATDAARAKDADARIQRDAFRAEVERLVAACRHAFAAQATHISVYSTALYMGNLDLRRTVEFDFPLQASTLRINYRHPDLSVSSYSVTLDLLGDPVVDAAVAFGLACKLFALTPEEVASATTIDL
jgi:hypothetical protein